MLVAHDVDFYSLVDSVRLAAVELFYELLFKLFHEERLARLRYGERGLYFMSVTEGDDAAARDEQWLIVFTIIVDFSASITAKISVSVKCAHN